MSEALFLRLLHHEDKSTVLLETVGVVHNNHFSSSIVYAVDAASFSQVPGSPFAYWVSEYIRRLFTKLPALGSEGRIVKQGLATADDFRFVRLWWEVKPANMVSGKPETMPEQFRQQTFLGKNWVPFAKGGTYSPYYSDVHLVVNWMQEGKEIKARINPESDRPYSNVWQLKGTEMSFFFSPGLTWPLRTQRGLSMRVFPAGCIFGHKGPVVFSNLDPLLYLIGLANSIAFQGLVALQMAFGSYEVGVIQRTSVPALSGMDGAKLGELALACINIKRGLDQENESSHVFHLPALLRTNCNTLVTRVAEWKERISQVKQHLAKYQCEIDNIAFRLYDIGGEDRLALEESLKSEKKESLNSSTNTEQEDEENASEATIDAHSLVADLLSYTVGCTYGRWDIRFATGERSLPELPDPFAPLPVCSPSMLTGEDGLPLQETPSGYPLIINWDSTLVDDPEHSEDIIRRVRDVLRVIWQERADTIEQEACQILGVKELRDYFRRSSNGGFWTDHIQRYSKSRRKAPIYWLLQSSKKNYAIWLYYHRLNKDTLFRVLNTVVEPKLRLGEMQLEHLRTQLTHVGIAGREARQLERQLERQENFISELEDFRDKLRRAADLNLEPDLNDGVVLNIAPLWELVPWNEAKRYWQELRAGKYEWSTIGKQLRERGLV